MTPTPISPPNGGTITQQTAGGMSNYVVNGACSGTAFRHTQVLDLSYQRVNRVDASNDWIPLSSSTTSGLQITVRGVVNDELFDFQTSAQTGSTCSTAANARQAQEFILSSSTTSAGGMGTAGVLYTASAGVTQRWAELGDTASFDTREYYNVWIDTSNMPTGWESNQAQSEALVKEIIARIVAGGLEFSNDGSAPSDVALPWAKMEFSLMNL